MNLGTVTDVMDILQQGYQNTSSTPLDRTVATRVVKYFIENGWLNAGEVAHIVKAAGGEVRIPERQLIESSPYLVSYTDQGTMDIVFKSREHEL